ncbi:MAG: glycosyltransferase family 4 protein [Gammaproteobacteria bacterium]|nr:glycosyltransferase family 4 protein [Gammaproteobacteria bacterium]
MERLNWHMADELAKFAEVQVVGPVGSAALVPKNVRLLEAPLKPLVRYLVRARQLARRAAEHWQPDVVIAGSGLTAPLARSAARCCNAHTAVYVHGLDVAAKNVIYRALWLPAIRHMQRVIANSRATAEFCRTIGVSPERIGIVHPGVTLPDPKINPQRVHDFRLRHALGDKPVLLSVGRLTDRKGLREFVAHCLPRIVACSPDAVLLIVGDSPRQALHAKAQTPESIIAAAAAAGVAGHVRFLGVITDYDELGEIYAAADVHVFPVREIGGDPEGFGMVAVEAAAHGLPTVAFATGGVVDAVADGISGRLVAPGDYATFADSVLRILAGRNALRASSIEFARQFAWPEFGVQIVAQLEHVVPQLL